MYCPARPGIYLEVRCSLPVRRFNAQGEVPGCFPVGGSKRVDTVTGRLESLIPGPEVELKVRVGVVARPAQALTCLLIHKPPVRCATCLRSVSP